MARRSDVASSASATPSADLEDGAIRLEGGRLFCPVCSRFFDKQKQLVEHQAGKRHAENVALAAALVAEYATTPWAIDGAADAVAAGFSLPYGRPPRKLWPCPRKLASGDPSPLGRVRSQDFQRCVPARCAHDSAAGMGA